MHDTNLLEDQPIAWTPSPEIVERSQLTRFMRQVGVSTWDELYQFSIRDIEKFTEEVLKFLDIKFNPPYEKLLDTSDGIEFPEWFRRNADAPVRNEHEVTKGADDLVPFHADRSSPQAAIADEGVRVPSAGLNITTMCLDRWQTDEMKNQPAVIWEGEDGTTVTLTYSELLAEVDKCAVGLRLHKVWKGDKLGIHLPMLPETVITLLAINRVGAVAVPLFSGYGVEAVVSRLKAVGATALFASSGFLRRGRLFDSFAVTCDALKRLAEDHLREQKERLDREKRTGIVEDSASLIQNVFGIGDFAEVPLEDVFSHLGNVSRFVPWEHLLRRDHLKRYVRQMPVQTSAEDPLIILYTSGTTGKPKGIAHTHASFPIKAAQDMAFGTDVGKGTRICWYTDIGWMMGPWLIYGALINGATICIYDGAPDYPTPDRMWEFCAKHKVEVLGISPTLVRALAAAAEPNANASYGTRTPSSAMSPKGEKPAPTDHGGSDAYASVADEGVRVPPHERHDLSALRILASTGEPWNPAPWWWLFEKVGNSKLPIINYSGGTEIAGGILMGNPLLSIKPCSFPAPCPGMDVDILDENGKPVGPNHVGELVIKQPWIGMARGFWREKERYLETYWRRFKNIWVHGDWAMRDSDGHWFILGRSDDTLKVAGKRVGPAEVESILVSHPLVTEAAVIGVPDEKKGTTMVAFCVIRDEGEGLKDEKIDSDSSLIPHLSSLTTELRSLVARDMGKPLAPSKIHFVGALPKTRNAKVMRRVLRAAYLGEDPGDLSALENPNAVEEIKTLSGK